MPLVTDYHQVKEVYQEATELGVALPVFCAEDRETLEAILASALEMGKAIGVEDPDHPGVDRALSRTAPGYASSPHAAIRSWVCASTSRISTCSERRESLCQAARDAAH